MAIVERYRRGALRLALGGALAGFAVVAFSESRYAIGQSTAPSGGEAPGAVRDKGGATGADLNRAVERGLEWLARKQEKDGSFGSESQYGRHVGITALACMAFVSEGSVPGRGRYAKNVEAGLDFILNSASEQSGLVAAETSYGPMYGHGFATLFLGEMFGMSRRPDLKEKLQKAVTLIVRTQNDKGGWRYHPVRADADLSVTICQVMALRSARNAGITVPKETIDRAIQYVRESQNPDGGFRYMLDSTGSMFARSAAGVAALYYAGVHDDAAIRKGLAYLMKFLPGRAPEQTHYFYGHYYAAQVMYLAGGDYWRKWWPAVRDELLVKQNPEGFWQGQAGDEYGTAMALIILQVPRQNLPIFQK